MNNEKPLISVITVTYNAENYIAKCIKSVYNQTYPNIELIIIDGGSTDSTIKILQENDEHIAYWKSEPDEGIYDAMNKGTKRANGEWLFFLGADDTLLEGFSEMANLLNDDKTIFYGQALCNNNPTTKIPYNAYRVASLNICHQSIFYPKIVFKKYQYETKYKVRADQNLNIICFGDNNLKFKFYPIMVSIYDPRGFSSKTDDPLFLKDRQKIIKKNLGIWTGIRYRLRILRHKIKGKKS